MPFEVRHGKLDFCFNFMYRTPSSYLMHSSEFLAPEAMFLSVCSFLLGLTSAVCTVFGNSGNLRIRFCSEFVKAAIRTKPCQTSF